jgi:hypothetical protein
MIKVIQSYASLSSKNRDSCLINKVIPKSGSVQFELIKSSPTHLTPLSPKTWLQQAGGNPQPFEMG